jgi:hypothetical protein
LHSRGVKIPKSRGPRQGGGLFFNVIAQYAYQTIHALFAQTFAYFVQYIYIDITCVTCMFIYIYISLLSSYISYYLFKQWRSQPDDFVPLCKFQLIIILYLEIECVDSL